ncbi:MAG TPA: hypothetical protein VIL39_02485 [Verrucomicrobiae bacterium]
MTRFHQCAGSLTHYSLPSQNLKPGHSRLPGLEADGKLLVNEFIKATSAPPLPARR